MHRYRRDARTNLFDWSTGVDVTIPSLTVQTCLESCEFVCGVGLLDKCTHVLQQYWTKKCGKMHCVSGKYIFTFLIWYNQWSLWVGSKMSLQNKPPTVKLSRRFWLSILLKWWIPPARKLNILYIHLIHPLNSTWHLLGKKYCKKKEKKRLGQVWTNKDAVTFDLIYLFRKLNYTFVDLSGLVV